MKITKIRLNNFRSFYSEHSIVLATSDDSPVSIFIGENGSGKTTLLNAIYWAFTGEFTKQFEGKSNVINKDAVQEGTRECFVELDIENGTDVYKLMRVFRKGDTNTDVNLMKVDSHGIHKPVAHELAQGLIERLMPKRLANWFIFDGEAIGHLQLKGDPLFKDEIHQTFGFGDIRKLLDIISLIKKEYRREEQKLIADEELDHLSQLLDQYEDSKKSHETQLHNLNITIDAAQAEINSVESQLTKYSQSEPIQKNIQNAQQGLSTASAKLEKCLTNRAQYAAKNVLATLVQSKLLVLVEKLNIKEDEQSLPQPFGTRLIQDIKELGYCICGTPVMPGSDSMAKLDALMERAATTKLIQKIFSIRSQLDQYAKIGSGFETHLAEFSSDIVRYESDINEYREAIRKHELELDAIPHEEIKKLKDNWRKNKAILEHAQDDRTRAKVYLEQTEQILSNTQQALEKKLQEKTRGGNIASARIKLELVESYVSRRFHQQEEQVLKSLESELTDSIYKYMTKNFKSEIDPNNYAVRVYDSDRRLVDLSTGETNLIKFAVIAAIVGMAANRTTISHVKWLTEPIIAPLIFDAPFSVVDAEYRAGIATNLANLSSQLILFFDSDKWDTELSSLLLGKVGKFYTLISHAKGDEKSTKKRMRLKNKTIDLNRYGSERDHTTCEEVSL
jgi:DNA sulfur modification protein DndD